MNQMLVLFPSFFERIHLKTHGTLVECVMRGQYLYLELASMAGQERGPDLVN